MRASDSVGPFECVKGFFFKELQELACSGGAAAAAIRLSSGRGRLGEPREGACGDGDRKQDPRREIVAGGLRESCSPPGTTATRHTPTAQPGDRSNTSMNPNASAGTKTHCSAMPSARPRGLRNTSRNSRMLSVAPMPNMASAS